MHVRDSDYFKVINLSTFSMTTISILESLNGIISFYQYKNITYMVQLASYGYLKIGTVAVRKDMMKLTIQTQKQFGVAVDAQLFGFHRNRLYFKNQTSQQCVSLKLNDYRLEVY